ncbi:hypothetical protein ACKKBG_A03270 [Auxenochlorella protothecoides x Auxenochlorella symbiontica]
MPGERFNVRLAPEEGGSPEPVVVEVGLEGLNLLAPGSGRALRKYPLHHISRWSMRGSSLILFAKSPVDVEDRTVVLSGDEYTIRSVLDTLTSSCMQMAELLQSGRTVPGTSDGALAASSLSSLLKKAKKPALLTADQVEFWHDPEKAGWMHSQGEVIRTWRKRWFVLKQGFLFRFSGPDVTAASRARGVVDLSTITDVCDGGPATGRPNSIRLSTATGKICYLADSETAQVEWLSALEGSVAAILRVLSGWEEEAEEAPARAPRGGRGRAVSSSDPGKALEETLQRSFAAESAAAKGPVGGSGRRAAAPGMISVVNYAGLSGGSSRSEPEPQYINVDYGAGIAGASQLPSSGARYGAQPYGAGPSGGYGGHQAYTTSQGYGEGPGQHCAPARHGAPPQYDPAQHGGVLQHAGPQQYEAQQQRYEPQQQVRYDVQQTTLFDAATAPQAAPNPAPSGPWQTHHTAEGRPYFYNVVTGITQWETPVA